MDNRQITDKVYYLIKDWDKDPDLIAYEILADRTYQNGDVEQFNEFILQLITELTKDKLVEYIVDSKENETADDYFVQGKMIAAKYTWEVEEKGWFYKNIEKYTRIHTLSKENEYLKYSDDLIKNGFAINIYGNKELDFSVNNPQTVIDYITSNNEMLYIWSEVLNPVCNILINPKYVSIEEFIEFLTEFVQLTGRTLEVDI